MKFISKITTMLLVLSILLVSVGAEETVDYFFEASFDLESGEATLTEKNLFTEKDFSNLLVEVTKRTPDGIVSNFYKGTLGGYDNGRWSKIDFSDNRLLLLYDWQTQITYSITPIITLNEPDKQTKDNNDTNVLNEGNNTTITPSSAFTITPHIKINNVNVGETGLRIIDNANMSCTLTVANNSANDDGITVLLATYTDKGKLHNVTSFNIDVASEETATTEIVYQFDAQNEYTGKIMFWDSLNNVMPIRASMDFSQTSGVNAYYYNADNRLLQVDKANGTSMLFTYDNMGNLLTRTIRK